MNAYICGAHVRTAIEIYRDQSFSTARKAHKAVLPLIRKAIQGRTLSYLELKEIVEPNNNNKWALHYRFVAGRIGDICEALSSELKERVPLLNAIIVNQTSRLPSAGVDGYLARSLGFTPDEIKQLAADERNAYARQAIQTVFDYDGWPRVCSHLQLRTPNLQRRRASTSRLRLPDAGKFARGPESASHKKLKVWAMSHPKAFSNYGCFRVGRAEVVISSGDRLDVFFTNGAMQLAVEVKSLQSPVDEIERGVFQCVKYRSVLRAMQLADGYAPNAQAVLVVDGPVPDRVVTLATILTVRILDVGKLQG